MRFAIGLIVFAAAASAGFCADNWPQFRGPGGQGHADDANLPLTWDAKKNVTWRTEIPGTGWSSPVVWGNQVWMTTAINNGLSLRAVCVDKTTGKLLHDVEVFTRTAPMKINAKNSHASPSPVIEDGRVYVSFGTSGTACLATDTGKIVWKNEELTIDHKEGPGSSPFLYKNLLVIPCDGIDVQYVAALHKDTGKIAWKTPRSPSLEKIDPDQRKAYCTPQLLTIDGVEQLVIPGAFWTYGYEPATGKELWRVKYPATTGWSTTCRPVTGQGMLILTAGFKAEVYGVRMEKMTGELPESQIVWRHSKDAPLKPSLTVVDTEVYMVSDNGGVIHCLDAKTGKVVWKEKIIGNYSASPIASGKRIYLFCENGKTHVLQAGKEFKLLTTNDLGEKIMATPAVSGNTLFLRTDKALYRIEETGK